MPLAHSCDQECILLQVEHLRRTTRTFGQKWHPARGQLSTWTSFYFLLLHILLVYIKCVWVLISILTAYLSK